MDNKTCYGRNPQCALYGRMAPYAQLKSFLVVTDSVDGLKWG